METYYVYILRCKGGVLYTGITPDVLRRIAIHYHKEPGCAKFTRSHPVEEVEMVWETASKSAALKAEYHIKKRMTKAQKRFLIAHPDTLSDCFSPESNLFFTPLPHITLSLCIKKEPL